MKFRHIIWDFDGTLFDSYPIMAAALQDALKEYGIVESVNAILSFMKVSMGCARQHYTRQYQLDDAFFKRFTKLRRDAESEHMKPFAGAAALCRAICKAGGQNYLFTHRSASAVFYLEKYGLLASFAELVTSEQNFPRKPSPDAILYLMGKHGFSQEEALMIGDRDLDIASGQNAGLRACYFANGGDPHNIAEYNVDCLSDIYAILDVDM